MTNPQISIRVEYTRNHFLYAIQLFNNNTVKRVSSILFPFLAIVSASFSLFLALNSGVGTGARYLFIALFYFLGIYLWLDRSGNLTSQRLFRRFQRDELLDLELRANNEGIFSKSRGAEDHFYWDSFVKFFENDNVIIAVLRSKQFTTFPIQFFADAEDIVSFRKLVRANVPEYKQFT